MIQCPKCSAENLPESRFCSSCGQELSSVSQMPTMEAPEQESPPAPAQSPHVGRIVSSDSVPAGGFTPGTILADRYRVIGLLGRGGGKLLDRVDLALVVPSDDTQRIQESHIAMAHAIAEVAELLLFPELFSA